MTAPHPAHLLAPTDTAVLSDLVAATRRHHRLTVLLDDAAFIDAAPARMAEVRTRLVNAVSALLAQGLDPAEITLAPTSALPELLTMAHALRTVHQLSHRASTASPLRHAAAALLTRSTPLSALPALLPLLTDHADAQTDGAVALLDLDSLPTTSPLDADACLTLLADGSRRLRATARASLHAFSRQYRLACYS